GRPPLQLVDAGRQALVQPLLEEPRSVAVHEPPVGRPEWFLDPDEPRTEPLQPAAVDAAPAVRRGDEDHAADLRPGPEGEGAAEQVAVFRVARKLHEWPVADE